jgi:hypothetical protein
MDPQGHSSVIFSPELPKQETISEVFLEKGHNIKRFIRPAAVVKETNGPETEGSGLPD